MKQQSKKREFSVLEDAGRVVDRELARLVAFVNDTLLPAARGQSEQVLRKASVTLKDMADRLAESSAKQPAAQAAPAPPPSGEQKAPRPNGAGTARKTPTRKKT